MVRQPIYNFCAGPSTLPAEVMAATAAALLDFEGSGLSLAEVGHRTKAFVPIIEEARSLMRSLLAVPDTHEVLFLSGGATLQFTMLAANLLRTQAAYTDTGVWATKAIAEAQLWGQVNVVASSATTGYTTIPEHFDLPQGANYLHITSNNTIYGTQWHTLPEVDVPLVADMSSDILTRPLAIERYDLIYGGAQKNLSMAGLCFAIVRRKALNKHGRALPAMLDYTRHIEAASMLNTPPTVPIYCALQTLRWIVREGGISTMQQRAKQRAAIVYEAIDNSPLFSAPVQAVHRSLMNIRFELTPAYAQLEETFLSEAKTEGLMQLRGHRTLGGFRASLYNAMPIAGAKALANFIHTFTLRHG